MPYIVQALRKAIENGEKVPLSSSLLNYQITKLCREYIGVRGLSYGTISDVTGVLENVKLEFYRRVVTPYEDMKIADNGDVYDIENIKAI